MLNLKRIFENEKIRKELEGDLKIHLVDFIDDNINNNLYVYNKCIDDYEFENNLHIDKERNIYLLESRLFSKNDGSMYNSYLRAFDDKINTIDEYYDDIWEYAKWEQCV